MAREKKNGKATTVDIKGLLMYLIENGYSINYSFLPRKVVGTQKVLPRWRPNWGGKHARKQVYREWQEKTKL